MPEFTEYQTLLLRRAQEDFAKKQNMQHLLVPKFREVTHKAQTVVDHPGWQWFLDSLETRKQEVLASKQTHTERMLFGPAMGQDLERLKIELNTMDAEIRAIEYAQGLVPQAITQGQEIISGVTTGVNTQVAAGASRA